MAKKAGGGAKKKTAKKGAKKSAKKVNKPDFVKKEKDLNLGSRPAASPQA